MKNKKKLISKFNYKLYWLDKSQICRRNQLEKYKYSDSVRLKKNRHILNSKNPSVKNKYLLRFKYFLKIDFKYKNGALAFEK